MAEKKNPVPTGGQMDIYRLGIICMAAILHCRILKRHMLYSIILLYGRDPPFIWKMYWGIWSYSLEKTGKKCYDENTS